MIAVLYPHSTNWFFAHQAERISADLTEAGTAAVALPSDAMGLARLAALKADALLVVSFAECRIAAKTSGQEFALLQAMDRFGRRVLVNYDCVWTQWFAAHLELGDRYFSDIFDVTMEAQAGADVVRPWTRWIPEAFTRQECRNLSDWTDKRPIPWTIIAHGSPQRAAFVAACLQALPRDGFVFCPPLRPFNDGYGLSRVGMRRVIEHSRYYIWNSHHSFPYHEALRALAAIEAGAVPVKIDPLFADISTLPWVYPSLEAFLARARDVGDKALYDEALDIILSHGSIGWSIRAALENPS